jgi:hypothetical protein
MVAILIFFSRTFPLYPEIFRTRMFLAIFVILRLYPGFQSRNQDVRSNTS